MVREQFEEMVVEILGSSGLMGLSYHELWARMLVQFGDEYQLVLRLVVALLVPADTSESANVSSQVARAIF
jgi:hypothetical protein